MAKTYPKLQERAARAAFGQVGGTLMRPTGPTTSIGTTSQQAAADTFNSDVKAASEDDFYWTKNYSPAVASEVERQKTTAAMAESDSIKSYARAKAPRGKK